MRLHRLELTAFGPFADRQQVDFDRLSAAGLFLLHGPTGAGKTSVLDAICFALYGRVPGVRGGSGRLRSDHAPAHVAPEVVCEFSVSGRRFEVTRSPEWQRPKKRGTGTVREQAHVVVRELTGGEWVGLTNRMDEAGDLLTEVIGLGPEQFTKLILLPQGDFAAFLRAAPEDRRPLLQKLFGTDRFAEVERWLADRRRDLHHHVQAADAVTARLYTRALEARLPVGRAPVRQDPDGLGDLNESRDSDDADVDIDAETDGGVPEIEVALDRVSRWAAVARAELALAAVQVGVAEREHEQARATAETATEQLQREARRRDLTAELARLRSAEAGQQDHRSAIRAASHALVMVPLLAEVEAAQTRVTAGTQQLRRAGAQVLAVGEDPAAIGEQFAAGLHAELSTLAALLPAAGDLAALETELATTRRGLDAAERELARAEQTLAELVSQQQVLTAEHAAAALLAVTLPDREQDRDRAITVARAVVDQQEVERQRLEAGDVLRDAIDRHQAAVDACQRLRARRLDGMAAELAAGLDAGAPCPVCGSCEHPAPTAHGPAAVTERAQQRAEAAEKAAQAEREQVQSEAGEIAQRWAALQAVTAGTDPQTAAAQLQEAESRMREARLAATREAAVSTELADVARQLESTRQRQHATADLLTAGRQALAELGARVTDLRERLDQARGDDTGVQARHDRLAAVAAAVDHYLAATRIVEESEPRLWRAVEAADQAATAAGFPDRSQARAALLPEAERERLARLVADHDTQLAQVTALLADLDRPSDLERAGDTDPGPDHGARAERATETGQPAVIDRPEEPGLRGLPPAELDPERLRAVQAAARAEHEQAQARHTLATRAVRALTGLTADLHRHAEATAPLRRQFAALDSVSKCVEGTGGDNALRMRLSSYVLAARLEQVAEAASHRLTAMSGGRFQLVHTDGPSRGGARSGLGLAVIDGWTGVQRDPASLSGGETFCTSLALALGLADVVQAEAGGSTIETLLVDEGFGSLDEQTLDEVMDVLDGLRSAGRSVGLVSHVADLRDRIPAQLRVHKTRSGSRLSA